MDSLSLKSPAKLNLFLEVRGLRSDGYHEVETVMQAVSLADTVTLFKIDNSIEITTDSATLSCGPDNLAYKAAELFFRETGIRAGVRIHLEKKIPAGAGLGGGSSNAAAVLLGLNEICGCGLSRDTLAGIAAKIGMDVPFFIYSGTALCTGRGECVTPLDCSGSFRYLVVKPNIDSPTARVYDALRHQGVYPQAPLSADSVVAALDCGDSAALRAGIFNRLQETVLHSDAELNDFYLQLNSIGGSGYSLTGSGTALYRVLDADTDGTAETAWLREHTVCRECDLIECVVAL